MKKIVILFFIILQACSSSEKESTKVSTEHARNKRVKNTYHKKMKYKDAVELYLSLSLNQILETKNLKEEDLSDKFLDNFRIAYMKEEELKVYEELISCIIKKDLGIPCHDADTVIVIKFTPTVDTTLCNQDSVKSDSIK